jgi:para-aminobenzoate synthetase
MSKALPKELVANAWTYDPEDEDTKVLMGIQHVSRPIFGVQWHPESVCSSNGLKILENFRQIALDFWSLSTPWNNYTRRTIVPNASLPDWLAAEGAIIQQARETHTLPDGSSSLGNNSSTRPYFVKLIELGTGPEPQHMYESFIRSASGDGEVWLDSSRVSEQIPKSFNTLRKCRDWRPFTKCEVR